jgi:hypothetical protein
VPSLGGREKEAGTMIRRLVSSAVLVVVAAMVVQSMPDIARYLKIRDM